MSALIVTFVHAPAGAAKRVVAGLTLAKRAVLSGQSAGFERIALLVHGDDLDAVRREVSEDARVKARVTAASSEASPAHVLGRLGVEPGSEIAVAAGDRVWTAAGIKALAEPLHGHARVLVSKDDEEAIASGMARVRLTDLNQLTLEEAIGAALLRDIFDERLEERALEGAWRPARDEAEAWGAETMLLRALIKPVDGVVSRNINRKISTALSRRLARFDVRPNHVTTVVALVGIMAGPLAYQGTYWGFLLGGLCYYVSAILDGCDGELARLKYLGTPMGAWLDTAVDDLVGLSWLVGMYAGLARFSDHGAWSIVGGVTIACYLGTVVPRYILLAGSGGGGDHQAIIERREAPGPLTRAAHRVRDVVFRTDFLPFYAFVTSAAALVPVFAVTYAAGAVLALGDTVLTVARFKRRVSQDGPEVKAADASVAPVPLRQPARAGAEETIEEQPRRGAGAA